MIETLEDVYAEALRIARAHRLTRDLHPFDRDDIAHAAVTSYMGAFAERDFPLNAAAWLEVAIRNEASDFLRRRRSRQAHEESQFQGAEESDVEDLLHSVRTLATPSLAPVQTDVLERLLALLPPGSATVLRLRFVDDLDAAEVATRLGIARAAVDQRVARAKRLMRKALGADPELAAELRQPHPRLY